MICGTNIPNLWSLMLGCLLMTVLIGIAVGLIVQVLKPSDAAKYVAVFAGFAVALFLVPVVVSELWAGMSIWQRVVLVAIVAAGWFRRQYRQPEEPRGREER